MVNGYEELTAKLGSFCNRGAITVDANGLATAFGEIDNMTYTYANNSNELLKIYDNTWSATVNQQLATHGFKDGFGNGLDYTYDENGNVTYDANKDVTITYNHLNLLIQFIKIEEMKNLLTSSIVVVMLTLLFVFCKKNDTNRNDILSVRTNNLFNSSSYPIIFPYKKGECNGFELGFSLE
jgi:hypothetical protein